MTNKTRILLVDDHIVVRTGIATMISLEKDLLLVGETDTGLDAVRLARELSPDVVIMDLLMPVMDGAHATAEILKATPATKVLILSTFSASPEMRLAMHAGAAGALIKTSTREQIVSAIRRVAAGERVVSDEVEQALSRGSNMPQLSPRQLEVLNLVANGYTNRDIAHHLQIGSESVKEHMKNIFLRLGVSTRAEAASLAANMQLL